MTIDNDMAALVGFGCEAFFNGFFTVLFALSIYLMFNGPRRGSDVNKPILIISVLLYLSCTTHFALEFSHFYDVLKGTGVKGFADETNVLVGADYFISIADFFGELILIYRCWLLWSKNYWIILLPSLTVIAGMVCVSVDLHLVLHILSAHPASTPASLVPLGIASFALPLATNVVVTSLIAMRIWYLSPRKVHDMRSAQFQTGRATIEIVVESGMLYLAVQLIFVILFAVQHPALGIVGVIAVQIYGIAPTLILVRVALGLSSIQSSGSTRSGAASSSVSQPTSSTQVRIGYSTVAFTDSGWRLPAEVPASEIKSKPSSGYLGSSLSSVENATAV